MARPRILVLRGGAIGDFVLTLPALQALRKRWPEAHIEVAGYPHIAELAQAGGLADRIISLDKADIARYFSLRPCISDEQVAYLKSFDFIVSYLYDPDGSVRRNMLGAGARQVIYGCPIVRNAHAIDHFMKPLEELAIYAEEMERPRLLLKDAHMEKGRRRVKKAENRVVAIHQGSGSPKKNWPVDKFTELAGRLVRQIFIMPMFIIGEADADIARELSDKRCEAFVLSNCSLVELAEALSACDGYVGNDSGVTHIAASLGIPVVALFGPTNAEIWAPRGPKVKVISGVDQTTEGLAAISVDEVFDSLTRMICN